MSRNNDRSSITGENFPQQDESPAPVVTQTPGVGPSSSPTPDQPAFSWSVPTEFVKLPSGGKFYPTGHPLHHQELAEIRYMTAKEEDILTSRALLKEGLALDRMLQNILVNQDIQVGELLVGDKNALIVAARRTGYGADYTTRVTCPSCTATEEFTFDIEDPQVSDYEAPVRDGRAVMTNIGTFVIELPMTKAKVECCLLTGNDEMRLYKEAERKAKRKGVSTGLTDAFRSYIVSVNGEGSPIVIESFLQALPARDARVLRSTYTQLVPNIDLTQEYTCPSCNYSSDMEVPLTADFFWPK